MRLPIQAHSARGRESDAPPAANTGAAVKPQDLSCEESCRGLTGVAYQLCIAKCSNSLY